MNVFSRYITAICCITAFCGTVQAAEPAKTYSVRDFFHTPEQSSFEVSPDGKYLSFMQPWEGRKNIFVKKIGSPEPASRITAETARDISGYFWKGNDHLLFAKDFGGDENFHVVSVGRDGKGLKDLTPYPKVRAEIVDDLEEVDNEVLISNNKRDAEVFDVYRVNVSTGNAKLVAQNPGNIQGWITDHKGAVRAATTTDGVNTSLLYRVNEKAAFKTVLTTSFKESADPLFFTFDNKKLYVSSNIGRDRKAIVIFDPAAAKEEEVIFERPDVDVAGLDYSKHRKVLTEIGFVDWKAERKILDPQTDALYKALQAKLPGYEIVLQSHSKDESKWVVAAFNDRTEGTRYMFDSNSGALSKLAVINPTLAEQDMAPMKPIQYKARDVAVRQGSEKFAGHRQSARRALGARRLGLQPGSTNAGQSRLCGIANELPRLHRIWPQVLGGIVQTMGQDHAGRYHRRCELAGGRRYCRSQACCHLWRFIWRLRDPSGRYLYARLVCGSGRLCGCLQHVYVHEDDPSILETDAR